MILTFEILCFDDVTFDIDFVSNVLFTLL